MHITIGSRGSDLALWQAHFVREKLEALGHEVTIKIIVTKGDRIQDLSFDKIEGKGFFTKEIENALLNNEIDLAVHSHKDLETTNPEGLKIGAVSYRENPTDLLLIRKESEDLSQKLNVKAGAIIGTSSARRKSQVKRLRGDAQLKDLRGNVPTRIEKLRNGDYDAIILASAGVARLNLDLSDLSTLELNPYEFVPAPAQGVLGLQIREEDKAVQDVMNELNHPEVAEAIKIERDVLRLLNGGCQLPLGAYCEKKGGKWQIHIGYAPTNDGVAAVSMYETSKPDSIAAEIVENLTGVKR